MLLNFLIMPYGNHLTSEKVLRIIQRDKSSMLQKALLTVIEELSKQCGQDSQFGNTSEANTINPRNNYCALAYRMSDNDEIKSSSAFSSNSAIMHAEKAALGWLMIELSGDDRSTLRDQKRIGRSIQKGEQIFKEEIQKPGGSFEMVLFTERSPCSYKDGSGCTQYLENLGIDNVLVYFAVDMDNKNNSEITQDLTIFLNNVVPTYRNLFSTLSLSSSSSSSITGNEELAQTQMEPKPAKRPRSPTSSSSSNESDPEQSSEADSLESIVRESDKKRIKSVKPIKERGHLADFAVSPTTIHLEPMGHQSSLMDNDESGSAILKPEEDESEPTTPASRGN